MHAGSWYVYMKRAQPVFERALGICSFSAHLYAIFHVITGVCEQEHSFHESLCHAARRQKLHSSPWCGALKAPLPEGLPLQRGVFSQTPVLHVNYRVHDTNIQKCTSKGIWRQGIVLKHRNSLQKSLCPVVIICPYSCSSDISKGLASFPAGSVTVLARRVVLPACDICHIITCQCVYMYMLLQSDSRYQGVEFLSP